MASSMDKLTDADIALMDTIKSILEVIMLSGIAKPALFEELFAAQQAAYFEENMPTAAAVMQLLRVFVSDPEREWHRETLRQVILDEPRGTA